MEDLALHTGAPTVHYQDNKSCIYVVEAKIVTPIDLKWIFMFVLYKKN